MPLNSSGLLSIGGSTAGQSINLELGRAATASSNLNESALRTLAGVASGQISISNFYGKSSDITSQYGLFGGGMDGSYNYTNSSFKYGYSTTTSVVSTNLLSYGGGYGISAAGNTSAGYFMGGRDSNNNTVGTVSKFTYSGNSVSAGSNLSVNRHSGTGFGNQTYGISASGLSGNLISNTWSRYTYSSNAVSSHNTLSGCIDYPDGCSNATYGLLSQSGSTSFRYTFSTNVFASATFSGSTYILGSASTATSTNGYFVGDRSSLYWNFSSLSWTWISSNGLSQNFYAAAAGNGTIGRYVGGMNYYSSAYTLTYSNNSYAGSTAPVASKQYHDATSNPTGSF